jgi:hypothetical protein
VGLMPIPSEQIHAIPEDAVAKADCSLRGQGLDVRFAERPASTCGARRSKAITDLRADVSEHGTHPVDADLRTL